VSGNGISLSALLQQSIEICVKPTVAWEIDREAGWNACNFVGMSGDRAKEGQQQATLDTPETAKADVRIAYLEWIGYITTAAHSTECSRFRIVESKDRMGSIAFGVERA
jgi:hypothetical protein